MKSFTLNVQHIMILRDQTVDTFETFVVKSDNLLHCTAVKYRVQQQLKCYYVSGTSRYSRTARALTFHTETYLFNIWVYKRNVGKGRRGSKTHNTIGFSISPAIVVAGCRTLTYTGLSLLRGHLKSISMLQNTLTFKKKCILKEI